MGKDAWQQRLRESGHRLTPQRVAVLTAVEKLGHATPEQVHAALADSEDAVNLSTVYRTLELLDELGVIRHAHLTDRSPTYHARADHEHVHLVCRGCREVLSIGEAEVAEVLGPLAAVHGFDPDYGHLVVFGQCRNCQGMNRAADPVG